MSVMQTFVVPHAGQLAWLHTSTGSTTTPHCLPAARVIVPLDAEVEVHTRTGHHRTAQCVLIQPNEEVVAASSGTVLTAFVDLRGPLTQPATRAPVMQLPPNLSQRLRRIAEPHLSQLPRHAAGVLAEIVHSCAPQGDDLPAADPRAEAAVQWIETHPAQPWAMPDLARRLHLSPGHLAHLVQRAYGTSARTLTLYHRARAAALLLPNAPRMADVAHRMGFADQAHMARALRRFFGKSGRYIRTGVRDCRTLPDNAS